MENGEAVQESASDSQSPAVKLNKIAADNNNSNDDTSKSEAGIAADSPHSPVGEQQENHVKDSEHLGSNGHDSHPPIPTSDLPEEESAPMQHDHTNEPVNAGNVALIIQIFIYFFRIIQCLGLPSYHRHLSSEILIID